MAVLIGILNTVYSALVPINTVPPDNLVDENLTDNLVDENLTDNLIEG